MKIKDRKANVTPSQYEEATEEEIKASHMVQYDSHRGNQHKGHLPNLSQINLVENRNNEEEFSQKSMISEATLQGMIGG